MGLDLQMLLYLFTIDRDGEAYFGHEIEPAGVLYLPARDQILTAERGITPLQLAALREKTLRRSGLLLENQEVLQAMEHEALSAPQYLPLRVDKNGGISGSLASAARLGTLSRYVDKLLHKITCELRDGNIDADPCCHSEEDRFCRFCAWASACHFQEGRGSDRLRYITPVKAEEFWSQIGEEEDT
jgi:ATP-dependent helicase/nuclease subunit B